MAGVRAGAIVLSNSPWGSLKCVAAKNARSTTIDLISRLGGIGWLMSKQSSQPPADAWLAFSCTLTSLLLLFGCLSRRLRIGEFALGLRL